MLHRSYYYLATLLLLASITVQAQNAVVKWNTVATDTVIGSAKKAPGVASIYLAYVQLAVYDAVSNIDRRFTPYGPLFEAPSRASKAAAVAAAAHRELIGLLPTLFITPAQQPLIPAVQALLDAIYLADLNTVPNGKAKNDGIRVGETAALNILALRAKDGREDPAVVFTPGTPGPGVWEPVPVGLPPVAPPPLAPWVGHMLPFTMSSANQFLPERGPSELDSKEWARDYNLTRLFGAKTGSLRTPEQTDIGLFWSDHATAQYARAFRKLAADQRLDTSDTARLLAMLMTVQADAFIGCMNAKYHFTFWRPYTAIRNGDIDGNPDTVADPNWLPLAPTPPHPEYPAAHGCVTSATANVLKRFFGTDDVHFSVDSLAFGVVQPIRQFSSFHGLVLEVRQARIYGGMHYHHSIVQGEILGTNVARQLVKNYFRSRNDD